MDYLHEVLAAWRYKKGDRVVVQYDDAGKVFYLATVTQVRRAGKRVYFRYDDEGRGFDKPKRIIGRGVESKKKGHITKGQLSRYLLKTGPLQPGNSSSALRPNQMRLHWQEWWDPTFSLKSGSKRAILQKTYKVTRGKEAGWVGNVLDKGGVKYTSRSRTFQGAKQECEKFLGTQKAKWKKSADLYFSAEYYGRVFTIQKARVASTGKTWVCRLIKGGALIAKSVQPSLMKARNHCETNFVRAARMKSKRI